MANGVCYVYWIHLPEHTDVFTTGYVGVTSKTVEERFSKHVSDATNNNWRTYTLHNAIRKYGAENLIVSTLIIGDEDYCYLMEAKLRPEKWTAWNVAKGGSSPPSPAGRVHKESSKAKGVQTRRAKYALLSAEEKSERYSKRRGVKLPEEWVQKLSKAASNRKPWKSSKAVIANWLNAPQLFTAWQDSGCCGQVKFSRIVGLSVDRCETFVKHFKSGWNPSEDLEYLAWREAYLAEQRKEPNGT